MLEEALVNTRWLTGLLPLFHITVIFQVIILWKLFVQTAYWFVQISRVGLTFVFLSIFSYIVVSFLSSYFMSYLDSYKHFFMWIFYFSIHEYPLLLACIYFGISKLYKLLLCLRGLNMLMCILLYWQFTSFWVWLNSKEHLVANQIICTVTKYISLHNRVIWQSFSHKMRITS